MVFPSRRLLPQTLTYTFPSPSPSPSPSDGITCLPSDPTCPESPSFPWPYNSPPPPPLLPPPPSSSPGRSPLLSTPGILAVSIVSSLFFLTIYFILLSRSRRNRLYGRGPRQGLPPPPPGDDGLWTDGEEWTRNLAMVHPIWLINTAGLQPAMIASIAVCVYRKGEGLIEGDYCSICLSEFEEGESLRLLPKCSHAFHIPCIDTWLRSHTNCPLCRAPILAPPPLSGSLAVLETTGNRNGSSIGEDVRENAGGGDPARDNMGDTSNGDEGGHGEEGSNEKPSAEEAEAGASVGRRSVSMDNIAIGAVNLDREGNERGRIGGVRSLPGSGRFR